MINLTEQLQDTTTPNRLAITEAEFNEIYPDLVGSYDFFNSPVPAGISKQEFERTYLKSKLWRLNNCYHIVNKDGNSVPFRMNKSQHRSYGVSRKHPRSIVLKSRQQGISTLWLVSYFDDALFRPLMNIGLMAQGDDEAKVLLERTKFLWDTLSPDVKSFLNINTTKDNTKEFTFTNRSTIFIRMSFRSTTLQRLHVSEFGKIANAKPKRAKETKTGTLQALARGNTGVFESTAEGQNLFKTMWDDAVLAKAAGSMSAKDFYPLFLSWLDDPDCLEPVDQPVDEHAAKYFEELYKESGITLTREQKNFWIVQYRELGEEIYQEYPATPAEAFQGSRDGTYYNQIYLRKILARGQVVPDLSDDNLPTYVFFDLGVDDYMVVGFFQFHRGQLRLVDEYYSSGYALEYYIREIEAMDYNITTYVFPHDIEVREQGSMGMNGLAKSRKQIAEDVFEKLKLNRDIYTCPKSSIADGIESVRAMLPHMYIDARCTYIVSCLQNYQKDFDERSNMFKSTPLHNEYSHGADMLRVVSQALRIVGWELGTVSLVDQDYYEEEDESYSGFAV